MKLIKLTQGKFSLVDDEDFEFLNQWQWFAVRSGKNFYAATRQCQENKNRKRPPYIRIHQLLSIRHKRILKDHFDGNGLNNQKDNLRPATMNQNLANSRRRIDNKSGFKGVWWCKAHRKWGAKIAQKALGWFNSPIDAAKRYDAAAIQMFGEYAKTNAVLGLL